MRVLWLRLQFRWWECVGYGAHRASRAVVAFAGERARLALKGLAKELAEEDVHG